MRVLVTGSRGYVGSELVALLAARGHDVTGVDLNLFAGCECTPPPRPHREIAADFRSLTADDLRGHDCVMHLAGLSNDPMGELDAALTVAVNRDGSVALAARAREAGVPRFLFASSCSVYGTAAGEAADEHAPLRPLSTYAVSKLEAEAGIAALASPRFSPVFLRCATAYGWSPMLRIDLVVNNLVAAALALGEVRVLSDGSPWRPLLHCHDMARAFVAFAEAPEGCGHTLAVNIGSDDENYRVRDVARIVHEIVPGAAVTFGQAAATDPRDYRVSFARLRSLLPGFALLQTVRTGTADLHARLVEAGFSRADFEGPRFVRLRTLAGRLAQLEQKAAS